MDRSEPVQAPASPRVAELVAALSLASDLGMGQPLEHALRTCIIAVGLGGEAGLDRLTLATTFHLALLRYAGCTADAHESARFFGDEIAPRRAFATIDPGSRRQVTGWLRRHAGAGSSPPVRLALATVSVGAGRRPMGAVFRAHCEVAQRLASRLGLGRDVIDALGQAFERWDGRGFPAGLRGEAVCPPARLVALARDAEVLSRQTGVAAALEEVRRRTGGAYDPALAALLTRHGRTLLAQAAEGDPWELALGLEPQPQRRIAPADLDRACAALGDFADLKSPHTVGRSAEVAELAEAAGWRLGMGEPEVAALRRAALVADLGRVGISNAIWDAPRPLTSGEWERVRLHPYLTERILGRCGALDGAAELAGAHHERLDGSGYHRGSAAAALGRAQRVLAAADVYRALREERPHRPARDAAAAANVLSEEVRAGRLDREAADAVLAAAGERGRLPAPPRPGGLTQREAEVLALIARGHSNRAIGTQLGISPKTVGRHAEAIYAKAGVHTRAAATLFAAEHGLLRV